MPVLKSLPQLQTMWSLWQPGNAARGLNLATDDRVTAGLILSALLLRPGEAPLHPELAIAPELFDPLSTYQPQYWAHEAAEHVQRWVAGLERLQMWMQSRPDSENRLAVFIAFRSHAAPEDSLLTFDYLHYQGVRTEEGIEAFAASIELNGEAYSTKDLPITSFRGFER